MRYEQGKQLPKETINKKKPKCGGTMKIEKKRGLNGPTKSATIHW